MLTELLVLQGFLWWLTLLTWGQHHGQHVEGHFSFELFLLLLLLFLLLLLLFGGCCLVVVVWWLLFDC